MPNILVADDSPVERRLVGALLTRQLADVKITYASDGLQALDEIGKAAFDAIVTDFQMPNLDGLELVERAATLCPGVPVVVITGCGSEATAVRALEAGAASYIAKHDIDHRLIETVGNVLALSQSRLSRRRLISSLTVQSAHFVLENDVSLITPLITWLQDQLATMKLCGDTQVLRIGVALHETLTNAIYHGNLELDSALRQEDETLFYDLADQRRYDPAYAARRVYVQATASREMVRYVVRDEGPGYDVHRVADPTEDENIMRVGGRGMLLIRSFMDEVDHNSKGNEITLVKYIQQDPVPRPAVSAAAQPGLQLA